jgi:hypothetical protein
MNELISRRTVLGGIAAAGSLGLLAGCGRIDDKAPFSQLLTASDGFSLHAQRLLLTQRPLVRELSLS